VNARRQFLVSAPIGLAGVIAACKNAGPDAAPSPMPRSRAQPRLRKMRRSQCTRPMHPRSAGS